VRVRVRTAAVVAAVASGLAGMLASGTAVAVVPGLLGSKSASLQERIDEQLRVAPGGVQISPYEVAYDGGAVIVSFPVDDPAGIAPPSTEAAFKARLVS
jgi:hypothetical protein